jgi:CRP/FNR family cyclic AMP-dependent transcriptional regulator
VAKAKKKRPFNVQKFLSSADGTRTISTYQTKQKVYSQGDRADAVFYRASPFVKRLRRSSRGPK